MAAGIFVAEGTLHPARRLLDYQSRNQAVQVALRQDAHLEDISLTTPDHIVLRAWLISPSSANGNVVLLLHGMSDNRIGMIGYAKLFLQNGYTVLMPDARAHGDSDGTFATYGLLEQQDIYNWTQWIAAHVHRRCVFGFGESMGAAQLLQSLQTHPSFCAVAAESPFASLSEIAYDRAGQFFHTGPWLGRGLLRPIIETSFLYSRWRYHLDLRRVSPETVVAQTGVPVFLIHGQADSNIPVRHSRALKSRAPGITLWEVPHADHCGAVSTAPQEFRARLLDWFATHDRGEGQ